MDNNNQYELRTVSMTKRKQKTPATGASSIPLCGIAPPRSAETWPASWRPARPTRRRTSGTPHCRRRSAKPETWWLRVAGLGTRECDWANGMMTTDWLLSHGGLAVYVACWRRVCHCINCRYRCKQQIYIYTYSIPVFFTYTCVMPMRVFICILFTHIPASTLSGNLAKSDLSVQNIFRIYYSEYIMIIFIYATVNVMKFRF